MSAIALEIAGCDKARYSDALTMLPISATVWSVCRSLNLRRRPNAIVPQHASHLHAALYHNSGIQFPSLPTIGEAGDVSDRPNSRDFVSDRPEDAMHTLSRRDVGRGLALAALWPAAAGAQEQTLKIVVPQTR